MSPKCDSCGSTDIDVDASSAVSVCTNCGKVLESTIIVSDVSFHENAHGGSTALGTFISSESKGGNNNLMYFSGICTDVGRESREITLRNAKKKIIILSQQLSLRHDRSDIAFNFFKMALARHLTRGRKSTHVIAACVYITCRTEGTSHMLIDFSDILQIDVYELGRTYQKLSQELCINIPAIDPSIYVLRFAHRLELGEKTHEVTMTALRLVSRMKKDWMHFGRRPSGICGAALLIAARLHHFKCSTADIIKIVKVHEGTLRKRLHEFGDTPASRLTLDEFMNIDLNAMTEEQDPPAFKLARRRDKERFLLLEAKSVDMQGEFNKLSECIDREVFRDRQLHYSGAAAVDKEVEKNTKRLNRKRRNLFMMGDDKSYSSLEHFQVENYIVENALETISEIVNDSTPEKSFVEPIKAGNTNDKCQRLMPPPDPPFLDETNDRCLHPGIILKNTIADYLLTSKIDENGKEDSLVKNMSCSDELDLEGIDDDEINSYIMSKTETKLKTGGGFALRRYL